MIYNDGGMPGNKRAFPLFSESRLTGWKMDGTYG